jgi:multimeric flavodoxin WrbA
MKVVAFNGSPRKDGNTFTLTNYVLEELEKEGIETELVHLAGKPIRGCMACYKCMEKMDKRCSVTNDIVNECIEKIIEAQGIVLASPTYFCNVTAEMKALIDRAGLVGKANGDLYKHKAGVAVVTERRMGGIHTFNSINHFYFISQMIVPGSNYWNMGIGMERGDVEKDAEGIETAKLLGQNMAWLLKKINEDAPV